MTWWGSKDADVKEPTSDPNAPPPLMFNPSSTGSTFISKTSRNPLSRPKRPSAAQQAPPASGQTQPISNPQSPLSHTSQQNFNQFPNFHGSETNIQPPEQPVAELQPQNAPLDPPTAKVDQYLTNYDYGNAPVDVQANNNNNVYNTNVDKGGVDNNVVDDGGGTMSAFFGGDDDVINATQDHPLPEQAQEAIYQEENSTYATNNSSDHVRYETEEQFNEAFYQHYGQNPPQEQWIAYQQQWEEYYRSSGENKQEQQQSYQESHNQEQQLSYQESHNQEQQQSYQESHNQEQVVGHEPEPAPSKENNQIENDQFELRYQQQEAQYQQQFQEYESDPQQNSQQCQDQNALQQLPSEHDNQSENIANEQQFISLLPHEQSQIQSPREQQLSKQQHQIGQPESTHCFSEKFTPVNNPSEQEEPQPPNEYMDNFSPRTNAVQHQKPPQSNDVKVSESCVPELASDFFSNFGGPTQNPTNSVFDNPVSTFPPLSNLHQPSIPQQSKFTFESHKNNLSPYELAQPSHDKHPSPVNPDNQFQKERDSSTPLWDKENIIIPRNDNTNQKANILSPPNSFEMPPIFPQDFSRSRNSTSSSRTANEQPLTDRTRTSSSTSKSQISEACPPPGSRSRTTSSTSFKNEHQVDHVEPPPQFNDFNPNPSTFAPPPTFTSAFVPSAKTINTNRQTKHDDNTIPHTTNNMNPNQQATAFLPIPDNNMKSSEPRAAPPDMINVPSNQSFPPPSNQSFPPSNQSFPPNNQSFPPNNQSIPTNNQSIPSNNQSFPHPSNQSFPPSNQSIHPSNRSHPQSNSSHLPNFRNMPLPVNNSQPRTNNTQPSMDFCQPPINNSQPSMMNSTQQQMANMQSPMNNNQSHLINNSQLPMNNAQLPTCDPQPTISNTHPSMNAQPHMNTQPHIDTPNTYQKVPDEILMPPPSNTYEQINLSKRKTNRYHLPTQSPSLSYSNVPANFAMPMNVSRPSSRPSSRNSDDTIARLRKQYEDNKIMKKTRTPDSIENIGSDGIGSPLLNSTSKPLKSMSMKTLRDSESITSAASIIAQQEAYENVVLRNEPTEPLTYENHELLNMKKPALPPKPSGPSLPPRPKRKGGDRTQPRSTSAFGHRRNRSQDSSSSFKSDNRYKYNDYLPEHSRSVVDDPRDRRLTDQQRDYYRMYPEQYDRYRRAEYDRYRQEELVRRRGYYPDDYRADRYDRAYGGNLHRNTYTGYRQGYGYDRDRGYYYDRSDALSVSRTESVRSDPISNETEDNVESSAVETTDTTETTENNVGDKVTLDDSLIVDQDSTTEVEETVDEVEDTTTALADLFTAPYLYTRYHARAQCFAPNRMICIIPGDDNDDGPPPKLELVDFKLLYWQEQKELEQYPGPFIKGETPKRDVMSYCKKQANQLRQSGCKDEGRVLLWELLALLCKQNGVIIGTDVAEILLQDHHQIQSTVESDENVNCYIGSSGSSVCSYTEEEKATAEDKTEAIDKIRECLFEGQRKEALEVSVKYELWDMALMIGTTLSSDTMSDTMQRFANSLHRDDPLKSFHQLISNLEPSACSGTANWRKHLAMVLSNQSDKYDPNFNNVLTMANTLASEGMVYASHVCCIMAGCKLTSILDKASPMALLGLDHTKAELHKLPYTAIQLTEIYEFAKSLGGEPCIVPYQAVKLHYAREVAKVGQLRKAIQYLQQISNNINLVPKSYRARFIRRVYDECMRMLYLENPHMKTLPEWTEKLKETLNNRNLGISNRSTAYSSRVATPEIQRVAQYLLHQQKHNTAQQHTAQQNMLKVPSNLSSSSQYSSSAAESASAASNQQQTTQDQATSSTSTHQQTPQDQATSSASNQQQTPQATQQHELESSGFVFDGQVYRHHMYPGYVYYEGQWYPDPNAVQTEQTNTEQRNTEQTNTEQTNTELPHTEQTFGSLQQQSSQITDSLDSGYQQNVETDSSYQPQYQEYQQNSELQYQYDQPYLQNSEIQPENNSCLQDNSGENASSFADSHGSVEYDPPKLYSYGGNNASRKRLETLEQEDELDGAESPKEGTNDTPAETGQSYADGLSEEEPAPPPAAPLTFFNPAQFGGGGSTNLLGGGGAMLPPLPPPDTNTLTEQPLSDDEIKTPTNEIPQDNDIDEDSLYSTKKPKKVEEFKTDEKKVKKSQSSEGFFSKLFKKSNHMKLPDDSKPTIYWDEKLGKYVGGSDSEDDDTPPPPTTSLPPSAASSVSGASDDKIMSAPSSPGSFRRKTGRGRLAKRYVDVVGAGMKKSATSPQFQ